MTPDPADTIVAVSSAPGPGLRAIVRLSGDKSHAAATRLCPGALPPGRGLTRVGLTLPGVAATLPADVYASPAPHTYTGQDSVEIHTVSSPPLVERLVAALLGHGVRAAQPGEFTLRAFLAGKKDLTQAEAVLGAIEARDDADLEAALAQMAGGLADPLKVLRSDLLDLLADVEAALDFADEDIEFVAQPAVLLRLSTALAHLHNLRRQLDARAVSTRPTRLVLVGEPNAGKSRLFNALAGGDALVSDAPGTTRDYLTAPLVLGGVACELTDTAGWQQARDAIESQAQALARGQSGAAALVLWCHPAAEPLDPVRATELARAGPPVIAVATKADLSPLRDPARIPCSAVAPGGLADLEAALAARVQSLARAPLSPSQSRCRAHIDAAVAALRLAHEHAREADPPEVLSLALREALAEVGAMSGAVYTNDLLDRVFSRFCIGK